MNLERKSLPLSDVKTDDAGLLAGYANVFGNVDRAGEIVEQGAFVNLDSFLKDGFLAVDHDWSVPVGYFTSAKQDEHGLYVEARFHDTTRAQEVRQVVLERLAAGKSVGMSIGYRVLADEWTDGVRYLSQVELFEASVVTVPANPAAQVLGAKSIEPDFESIADSADKAIEDLVSQTRLVRSYLSYLYRKHIRS